MAVALVVIELTLRVVAPGENIPQREYDPHLGWRGRPDLDCVLNEGHFTIPISQNSRGFRDVERSLERPPGVTRVLCCGDSFTWGWGVEQDDIYTTVLERRYAEAAQAVEVLNVGVGGYSTDQLLLYLLREGFSFAPDYVVYQAAGNDVRDNPRTVVEAIYCKPAYDLEDDGGLALRGFPVPPLGAAGTLKYFVSRHSRLAYFLKHRIHLARFAQGPSEEPDAETAAATGAAEAGTPPTGAADAGTPPTGAADAGTSTTEPGVGYPFRLFCRLVAEMNAACRERGARFVVLIDFPVSDEEAEHWERVCGAVEARFVYEHLTARAAAAGTPAYIPYDGHWTADGHRWIADLLHDDVLAAWNAGP